MPKGGRDSTAFSLNFLLDNSRDGGMMELIDIAVLVVIAHAVNVFCFIILAIHIDKIRDKLKKL